MIVVCDTSPITNLLHVDQLEILPALFGEVIVESTVFTELAALPWQKRALTSASWLRVLPTSNQRLVEDLSAVLDPGEAASIALALELRADFLLIDERKGRKVAAELGVPVTGLLGILLQAKSEQVVDLVRPILDQMIEQNGFRIQEALYQEVLRIAEEV